MGAIWVVTFTINLVIVIWFASLGGQLARLQIEKVENDIYNTIQFREDTVNMAKEILQKAERRAENKITVSGGNAVFAIDGSTVTGVSQTITVEGNSELIKSLALLVSYCEESGNSQATKMATQLSEEATRENPNKGILFDLWTGITTALPEVSKVVKIAEGIKGLFV